MNARRILINSWRFPPSETSVWISSVHMTSTGWDKVREVGRGGGGRASVNFLWLWFSPVRSIQHHSYMLMTFGVVCAANCAYLRSAPAKGLHRCHLPHPPTGGVSVGMADRYCTTKIRCQGDSPCCDDSQQATSRVFFIEGRTQPPPPPWRKTCIHCECLSCI